MTEDIEENAGASEDSSMSFAAAEARKALIEEMRDSGFARPAGMQNSAHAVLKDRTGKRTILIEGHHRHTAYKRGGFLDEPVAVEWFEGSVDEAVCASMMPNTKHKLPMVCLPGRSPCAGRQYRCGHYEQAGH